MCLEVVRRFKKVFSVEKKAIVGHISSIAGDGWCNVEFGNVEAAAARRGSSVKEVVGGLPGPNVGQAWRRDLWMRGWTWLSSINHQRLVSTSSGRFAMAVLASPVCAGKITVCVTDRERWRKIQKKKPPVVAKSGPLATADTQYVFPHAVIHL